MLLVFPGTAYAQSATVSNTTVGTIGSGQTCASPAAPLVRNFTVSSSFTITDVNIGILVTHPWRGDLRFILQSPSGTRVQLTNGDVNNISGDNFNVLLDDGAASLVNTDGNTTNHSTGPAPPYQNTFRPRNALSAFNGQNSAGTWRLEACDLFPSQDDGQFQNATLYLSGPTADLSLTKTVSNAAPANGTAVSYTLTVTSAASSSATATGVQVRDILPAGFTFVSSSGTGTYNSGSGLWTVGSVPVGASRSLTINGTVNATSGATVTNTAEIIASSLPDPDSTVNNGVTTEDDYANRSFTVSGTRVAGTPPNLSAFCPAVNHRFFDWQGRTWTTGTTNNSYTLTGIGLIDYNLTTDVAFVTGSPAINTTNTGGFGATEQGLFVNLNNNTQSDEATIVMTLPTAVPGLQFRVFDIDFGNNSFADKLTVTGSYDGATVLPTLTNGIANYVTGNVAIGDAASNGPDADGNVVVTFLAPVDTVTIKYGNHTTAPTNPGNQFMTIHDITYCGPETTLSVTKVSSIVSDPINSTTNPKAIPGAVINYCILVNNAGSATATSIVATDNIPSDLTFTPGTIRSGTSCGTATTVEDDNNAGADESDPFGAAISGSTLTMTAGSLGPSDNMAITFQATVN